MREASSTGMKKSTTSLSVVTQCIEEKNVGEIKYHSLNEIPPTQEEEGILYGLNNHKMETI